MPTIFSYVLGRPAALQTIEEIPSVVEETPVVDEAAEVNPTILGDEPES